MKKNLFFVVFFIFIGLSLHFSMPLTSKKTNIAFAKDTEEKVLNMYNWSEYIPQEVLDMFTKQTGIKIVYSTYESNEAMFAKVKLLTGKGYDLIVPSTYFVELMRNQNLLGKIDKNKLKNFKEIDPKLLGQDYDPENEYSIPYMWGLSGIMINKKHIDPSKVTSWKDLNNPKFKNKLLLSDDLRDTLGIGLKASGFSVNSKNPEEIKKAADFIKELKPLVKVFDITASKQALISEEVTIGAVWNGDAYIAKEENPDLEFIYPKDGAIIWIDSFVIPVGAEHKENALAFIDFILDPEINKLIIEEFKYSPVINNSKDLLSPELKESNLIFPTAEDLINSEITVSVGEAQAVYDKLWEEIKTK